MITARQRQLEVLYKGLNVEEQAVEKYTQYLHQTDFWNLLTEQTANGVKANLDTLARESKLHIDLVTKIIDLFTKLPDYG